MWRRRNVITKTEVASEHLESKYSVQKYQVPVTSTNVSQGLDTFGLNTLILDVSMCTPVNFIQEYGSNIHMYMSKTANICL